MPVRPLLLEETELPDLGFRQHAPVVGANSLFDSRIDLWRIRVALGSGGLIHLSIAQTIFPDGTR